MKKYPSPDNQGSADNGCISNISFLSCRVVVHFHDYGRKSNSSWFSLHHVTCGVGEKKRLLENGNIWCCFTRRVKRTKHGVLGCPRKLGMGYNLLVNGVYWGCNLFTNLLLISWDILVLWFTTVGGSEIRASQLRLVVCPISYRVLYIQAGFADFFQQLSGWLLQSTLQGTSSYPRNIMYFKSAGTLVGDVWKILRKHQSLVLIWNSQWSRWSVKSVH